MRIIRSMTAIGAGAAALVLVMGGSAAASRNGPEVTVTGAWAKFYADSSPNGTGDTLGVIDTKADGHSAVGWWETFNNEGKVWNTKGVWTEKYSVVQGGLPEEMTVMYVACTGEYAHQEIVNCSDMVYGIS